MISHFERHPRQCAAWAAAVAVCLLAAAPAWGATAHRKYATVPLDTCNECHKDLQVALNHGPLYARDHRTDALKSGSNCKQCHEQSFCADCHYGGGIDPDLHRSNAGPDYLPRSHRTDFRELHPLKAHDDPAACQRCHDNGQFCAQCHSRFNNEELRGYSHRKGWSDLETQANLPRHGTFTGAQCQTCHPNSLLPKHEWSAQHAREARQDLAACQSCHAGGEVCLQCHSAATGLKQNPHPRDWAAIADKMRAAGGSTTCNKCHP